MEITDTIQSLYNKNAACIHCLSCKWEISEPNDVPFKKMTFFKEGVTFGIIDDVFYKNIPNMTCNKSSFLKDANCDGVSFCIVDGKMHLLFVDLKSNIASIEKAFEQDFFTMLKIHMFFSLCRGYDLRNLTLDFFVACPPYKDKDQESDILSQLNMADESDTLQYYQRCLLNHLLYKKETIVKIEELPFKIKNILNESIITSQIHLHIYTPESYGESEGLLDLGDYFDNFTSLKK